MINKIKESDVLLILVVPSVLVESATTDKDYYEDF